MESNGAGDFDKRCVRELMMSMSPLRHEKFDSIGAVELVELVELMEFVPPEKCTKPLILRLRIIFGIRYS